MKSMGSIWLLLCCCTCSQGELIEATWFSAQYVENPQAPHTEYKIIYDTDMELPVGSYQLRDSPDFANLVHLEDAGTVTIPLWKRVQQDAGRLGAWEKLNEGAWIRAWSGEVDPRIELGPSNGLWSVYGGGYMQFGAVGDPVNSHPIIHFDPDHGNLGLGYREPLEGYSSSSLFLCTDFYETAVEVDGLDCSADSGGASRPTWQKLFADISYVHNIYPQGDVDHDHDVDFGDFATLSTNFGTGASDVAVSLPEPTAQSLLASGTLVLCVRRPRVRIRFPNSCKMR